MNQAGIEVRLAVMQWKPKLLTPLSTIQRYGLAVLAVCVALGGALILERFHFRDVEVPLFLFAVALSAWYGGTGAAVLALLLSCIGFDYFFVHPFYSFYISSSDLPYFIVFAAFASLVTWFNAVRSRVERELGKRTAELEAVNKELEALAEEKLRRSEAYLAEAQKLSHTGSFGWDVSSGEIYWSRETFRIFGFEPTAEVTNDLILQRTHPEDRSALLQLIERVSRERKEWDFEHRLLMPGQLLISITDTGIGLPPEHAEQILNPFFSTKPQGTGMGLPISRSIIESHGGRLWAVSNSGPGATFHFTLPLDAKTRDARAAVAGES